MIKEEKEFKSIVKKYAQYISDFDINRDSKGNFTSADIYLKKNYAIYLLNFQKKRSAGTDIDVVDKFNVVKSDITKGGFANSFDGFTRYDNNDKLAVVMGIGYIYNNDIEIITPEFIGNVNTKKVDISTLLYAWDADSKVLYRKKETARQKTDDSVRQRPAGTGIQGTKGKASTFVYSVKEVKSVNEKSGLPVYGKAKEVKVRRVDQKSADNYIKSMYAYKKTGKLYFVELKSIK
jgi:hypothetical protein